MGRFTINVSQAVFAYKETITELDNGNLYCYEVYADPGDSIDITLTGNYSGAYYVLDGGAKTSIVGSSVTVVANDTLQVCFYLASSTITGTFNSAEIEFDNTTTSEPNSTLTKSISNERDDSKVLSTSTLSSYEEPSFTITAGVTYTINTGLSSIKDVSIYDNTGADITATLTLTISGGDLDIDSTNTLTENTAKIIGEA